MKNVFRFSVIVALCTLAVLIAIPPFAAAQIIPNWRSGAQPEPARYTPAVYIVAAPRVAASGVPRNPPICGWKNGKWICGL